VKRGSLIRPPAPDTTRTLRLPFYGWFVVAAAVLITFSTGPGQSYVFSVVIDPIIAETGLSRTLISALYAGGTAVSAAMTFVIGRMVDQAGARRMLGIVALLLGLACLGLAVSNGALGLFLGFAALRALGQGSLPVIATLLVAQWFVRYRGRAMAIVALGFAASNAFLPPLTQQLVTTLGWRGAYVALAGLVWALLLPAFLLARNRPELLGLFPDGADEPPAQEQAQASVDQLTVTPPTLREARFWMLALPMAAGPFVVTALVFHQASIFAERGLSAAVAAGVFSAFAGASATMMVIAGFLVDRIGPKRMALANLLVMFSGVAWLTQMNSAPGAVLYAALLGASSGGQSVVGGVAWATYYGRKGLGRLQGAAAMVTISAAALAPLPLAALQQTTGSYRLGLLLFALVPLACFALLLAFRPPVKR
jgi:MFS family permease